ncbi:hypothetical protein TNCT_627811 [Trichonephila clavata]|uniref:Uncharacterized protein n=1 Tax=Trichonephila clavata TaxID=2740835 RepID=A0A8X6F2U3_TRICU|nr:hypothetical protein TNCT_627811 [Trichonephila clavata]
MMCRRASPVMRGLENQRENLRSEKVRTGRIPLTGSNRKVRGNDEAQGYISSTLPSELQCQELARRKKNDHRRRGQHHLHCNLNHRQRGQPGEDSATKACHPEDSHRQRDPGRTQEMRQERQIPIYS